MHIIVLELFYSNMKECLFSGDFSLKIFCHRLFLSARLLLFVIKLVSSGMSLRFTNCASVKRNGPGKYECSQFDVLHVPAYGDSVS